MANDILRVGIIGCGAIAQRKHLPSLQKRDDVEVVAFYDLFGETAHKCANTFGSPGAYVANSVAEIFNDVSIDVLYICTPNQTHADLSIQALAAGKHVMCEKPMATTTFDARKMLTQAQKSNRVLNIAFQNRFAEDPMTIKRLCEEGLLADIYHVRAYAVRKRSVPTWGQFLDKEMQGGGPLIDIGSHVVDMALWLADNYHPAYALGRVHQQIAKRGSECNRWGSWDPAKFGVEDSAFGLVVMENGMTLSIESAWALNTTDEREATVSIYGSGAGVEMLPELTIVTEMGGRLVEVKPAKEKEKRMLSPDKGEKSPGDRETAAFIQAVRIGDIRLGNANQALVVTEIIEAIYTSSETRKPYIFGS